MKLQILDGSGIAQTIIAATQEAVVDHSSTITVTNTAQNALAANANRSGYFFQNLSTVNPMYLNELGTATAVQGSIKIPPGGTFPPAGYPVSTGALSVLGTAADPFTCREW